MSDEKRDPVFYYSRERRLQRASETVRNSYREEKKKRGILGLLGSKGNVLIFICIILIIGMASLGNYITKRNQGIQLEGNNLSLSLIHEGDELVLGLLKTVPGRGEFYIGEVEILVSPAAAEINESEVFAHRIFFSPVDSETFILPLPFDGDDFFVILRTSNEQRAIRLKP